MKVGAVIVETRSVEGLCEIIQDNHLKFLPKDWGLTIYCSKKNFGSLYPILDIDRKIEVVKLPNEFNVTDYNQLLTSVKFWNSVPYDKVLVFQSDSALLKEGIEDFLEWDYIGASWTFNKRYAGNGGLSLRSRRTMIEVCKKFSYDKKSNEDIWITEKMYEHKIGKLAPVETADLFSVEAKIILGSLGYHGIDKWLSEKQCKLIRNQYLPDEKK